MKNILIVLLVFALFYGCKLEKNTFDISIPVENLSFKPTTGGAIMHYKLPHNSDIFAIRVRYVDAQGQDVMIEGSYLCDSLEIIGFAEARTNVSATVSLCNRRNEESDFVNVTFSTEDSSPVAFFETATVSPSWNGFTVIYDAPKTSGLAHVLYLGINPLTHEEDTLLVKSFPITEGRDTLFFSTEQDKLTNTVVIRTEDSRGFRAKEKVWKDVEAYQITIADLDESNFLDPSRVVYTSDTDKTGVEYLFDGDLKGQRAMESNYLNTGTVYTFVAGPRAVGKPFILELDEPKIPASMRFYGILRVDTSWPIWPTGTLGDMWKGYYISKLPCNLSVFASNDKDDDDSWQYIGNYAQDPTVKMEEAWARRTQQDRIFTVAELNAADPCFIEIKFFATPTSYKYIKFIVNDVFQISSVSDKNTDKWITIHEVELYVKKD